MNVGERLKEWRGALSQKAAALACGIKQQAWNRWEKNETEPGADSIRKICSYFGRTSDELLGMESSRGGVVTVHAGDGAAVAVGTNAKARAGSTPAMCQKCPHLKKLKQLEKLLAK